MAVPKLLPFCIIIFTLTTNPVFPILSLSSTLETELLLTKIKPSLQGNSDNILLASWNTSVPLCQWKGLKWVFTNGSALSCSDLASPQWTNLSLFKDPLVHVASLQLPSAGLFGKVPRELGELSNLKSLYLGVNHLVGEIPLELGYSSSLSDIDLGNNLLNGSVPTSIWNLCDRLISFRVHANFLSGAVPRPALPNATCDKLEVLDFGHNMFSGDVPEFLTRFTSLKELDLGSNMFSGSIPEGIVGLSLEKLNLSYNNFTGVVPNFGGSKFGGDVFEGNNPGLCGGPLRGCTGSSGLSSGAIAGIVIGLMAGVVVLASLLIGYVQGKKRKNEDDEEYELADGEDDENGGGEGKLILFQGGENLTLEDVLNATGQVMEKTSYGTVYKAKLADGGTIVLRLLRDETRVGKPVLNWAKRHKIALGIARGLAHLHTSLETPITHEILLGKKPGKARSGSYLDLPSLVKEAVLEETTMEVFDVEVLKGIRSPMEDGLVQALKLAMGCCAPVASVRPTMDEVVKQLEENRPRNRSALYSPTETRSEIEEHLYYAVLMMDIELLPEEPISEFSFHCPSQA
uniref:Protein kinase domain-containing protein n=1 Tax=Daucus carota subsp. sativus TaxID=79200 RepID=A0A166FK23_DAUCS